MSLSYNGEWSLKPEFVFEPSLENTREIVLQKDGYEVRVICRPYYTMYDEPGEFLSYTANPITIDGKTYARVEKYADKDKIKLEAVEIYESWFLDPAKVSQEYDGTAPSLYMIAYVFDDNHKEINNQQDRVELEKKYWKWMR